jgi:hypothetical protein
MQRNAQKKNDYKISVYFFLLKKLFCKKFSTWISPQNVLSSPNQNVRGPQRARGNVRAHRQNGPPHRHAPRDLRASPDHPTWWLVLSCTRHRQTAPSDRKKKNQKKKHRH